MNKKIFTSLIIFCIIGCTGSRINEKNKSSNKDNDIVVESKHFDFGKVSDSEVDSVSFSFTLNNTGDKDVAINDIDATCPCVVLSNNPKNIPHNNSTTIRGKMGIKGAYGKQNKAIFVNYEDKNILLLRIVGEVSYETRD